MMEILELFVKCTAMYLFLELVHGWVKRHREKTTPTECTICDQSFPNKIEGRAHAIGTHDVFDEKMVNAVLEDQT